ncbi:CGNR zinc finger domain-containing protein [Paenibacillus aurantius]|uniref:CGNR zinc finger domain-containing protein n=1 Tax=Paenibacillus aurantius TaxID=2918900 RepID=A0AA96LAA3_9BACL|nr:CGNR zinc finger domain-containing protein [Paenibacillus aurantius]WNQ09585.1 CGNR zinc finger domain-containing protein [Paenibacillus aurantius]
MPKKVAPSFFFIGNHPALDFINTEVVSDGKLVDLLGTWEDILNWLSLSQLFTKEQIHAVKEKWGPAESKTLVADAVELRTSLQTLVKQAIQGAEGSVEATEHVNRILKDQVTTTRLLRLDGGFFVERQVEVRDPSDLLIPVAEAGVDLLAHVDFGLVRKCGNPDCVLHFYDNSKNGTRRWCSQKTCGNRMKVAAYLERRKPKET